MFGFEHFSLHQAIVKMVQIFIQKEYREKLVKAAKMTKGNEKVSL
jgi:hypothetical protein